MKKIDVTKSVMDSIVSFESKRTKKWLGILLLVVVWILISIVLVGVRTYGILSERHTLDVLEILYQDREIIAEFWQDTLLVAWEEFPQQSMFIGVGLISILIGIWIVTKRRRKIMVRRIEELAKRQKRRNNT